MDDRWWFSPLAHHARWTYRGDDGFSLIEVLVALLVMAILLGSVAYTLGIRVSTISSARNEQAGQALLTKALNEVRAMPYTTVRNGLTTTAVTPTTPTSHVKKTPGTPTTWIFYDPGVTGTGEQVPHGAFSPAPPAPYDPQRATQTVNGVPYTLTTVPTNFVTPSCPTPPAPTPTCTATPPVGNTTGVVRVTVVVSWPGQGHSLPTTLVGQTVVYSASAAGNTTYATKTNPYAAPYEPNFTASASAGGGSITVRDDPNTTTTPLQGLARADFTSLGVSLTGTHSYSAFIRTSSVLDWTRSTGAELAGTTDSSNGAFVSSGASSDPSSPDGTFQSNSMTSTASTLAVTATNGAGTNSIAATPSPDDSGVAVSTASAAATQGCTDLSGTDLATSLACGSSTASQTHDAGIVGNFYRGSANIARTVTLAHIEHTASTTDRTFSARYPARTGTAKCTKTRTPWGCASAGAQMYLGKVVLGGLPQQPVAFTPPGWQTSCGLVCLTHFSAQASSWAKSGPTISKNPHVTGTYSVPVSGAATPTLYYYNGTTYTLLAITRTTPATTITPSVDYTKSVTSGNITITIKSTLRVNATTVSTVFTTPTCATACHVTESVGPPLNGTIYYTIKAGNTAIADFAITVDLGSVSSRTTYQEAT